MTILKEFKSLRVTLRDLNGILFFINGCENRKNKSYNWDSPIKIPIAAHIISL